MPVSLPWDRQHIGTSVNPGFPAAAKPLSDRVRVLTMKSAGGFQDTLPQGHSERAASSKNFKIPLDSHTVVDAIMLLSSKKRRI